MMFSTLQRTLFNINHILCKCELCFNFYFVKTRYSSYFKQDIFDIQGTTVFKKYTPSEEAIFR